MGIPKEIEQLFYNPHVLNQLEVILLEESLELCSVEELCKIDNNKEEFKKSELEDMLSDAKAFVDERFKVNYGRPKIGYFSVWDPTPMANKSIIPYGLGILGLTIPFFLGTAPIVLGPALGISSALFWRGYSKYRKQRACISSFYYNDSNRKITVCPSSRFFMQGGIAHEYSHYAMYRMDINAQNYGAKEPYLHETFARGIQMEYDRHLAKKYNDPRYMYKTQAYIFLELLQVYIKSCQDTKRPMFPFVKNQNDISNLIDHHSYGSAILKLWEKLGLIDYNNFNPKEVIKDIQNKLSF